MNERLPTGPLKPPCRAGIVALAAVVLLVSLSLVWLRKDERLGGALVLATAVRLVYSQAVLLPSPQTAFEAAATGMMSALDPFSSYLSPTEYAWFTEEAEGEYVGIGIEIKASPAGIMVVHVFPQSPAADAMIRPGDRIVAIGSHPTAGFTPSDALRVMRGEAGTAVTIEIETRDGGHRTLTLARERVPIEPFPVFGISRSGVAYIRWSQFSSGSGDQLAALLEDLNVAEPVGLILDLRGNPGGILSEAVTAAGCFLPPDQLVCRLAERGMQSRVDYLTAPTPSGYQGPLVIVMDETSASASEVLAAALWEAKRVVTVGRQSFGKGWVQAVFPLGDAGALRLSTARYYTPQGNSLGDPYRGAGDGEQDSIVPWAPGSGLLPDVAVESRAVGVWERALSRAGVFSELAGVFAQDWPDPSELPEILNRWCDSLHILPEGTAGVLLDHLQSEWSDSGTAEALGRSTDQLRVAAGEDAALLFAREGDQLLLRIWEKRFVTVARPDPGELETFFDLDPDLRVARDILEEPERYRSILSTRSPAGPASSTPGEPRDSDG